MPEFILDRGSQSERFKHLDTFTQGYVTAAFWTEGADGNACDGASLDDLAPEAWQSFIDDCRDFQEANQNLLERASETRGDYDAERAGIDFWLTRNRHGAGFWDRGLGEVGNELTKNAHPYGEVNLYRGDDEKIYA